MHGGRFSRAGNCGFRGQEELPSGTTGELWGRGKEMSLQVKIKSVADTAKGVSSPTSFSFWEQGGNYTSCLIAVTWGYVIVFSPMD